MFRRKDGQAFIEFAMVVPLMVVMLVVVVVLGLIINAKITVSNTAHEAGRLAAVTKDESQIRSIAEASIQGGNLMLKYGNLETFNKNSDVRITRNGETVTVDVRYRQPTIVPGIGALMGNPGFWDSYFVVSATATFVDESER